MWVSNKQSGELVLDKKMDVYRHHHDENATARRSVAIVIDYDPNHADNLSIAVPSRCGASLGGAKTLKM